MYDWEAMAGIPARTRLYVLDTSLALAPDWIELNLPSEVATAQITQIMVDPNNPFGVFFITNTGQMHHMTTSPIVAVPTVPPNQPPNFTADVNWVRLNAIDGLTVPPPSLVANATGTNVIAIDPNVATNPNDDILYLGTNNGVFSLQFMPNQMNRFIWQRVGGLANRCSVCRRTCEPRPHEGRMHR